MRRESHFLGFGFFWFLVLLVLGSWFLVLGSWLPMITDWTDQTTDFLKTTEITETTDYNSPDSSGSEGVFCSQYLFYNT
jgi:hypothetical protein